MTMRLDAERALDLLLAPDRERLPDRVLENAILEIARTPQRRALRLPWRFPATPALFRSAALAVAAVALLAVAGGALYLIGNPGPSASAASPEPSPTVNLDTATWTRYTSARYGFSIAYPPVGWTVTGADHDWTFGDASFLSAGVDRFDTHGNEAVHLSVWSVRVPPGTKLEDWANDYCSMVLPCSIPTRQTLPPGDLADTRAGDGQMGRVWQTTEEVAAFFLKGQTAYAAAIWSSENDPSVQPWGGARRLLEAFVSTMRLNGTSGIDTTNWTPYTSARYGLKMAYPPDWTVVPADHAWTWNGDAKNWLSTGQDAFIAPGNAIRVSAWTVPLDKEVGGSWADVEAWAIDYCTASSNTSCTAMHSRVVPVCIENRDCHAGLIVPFEGDVQFFGHGGILPPGMTVVAVWRSEQDPSVTKYGGSQALIEAFLSTMGVYPPYYADSKAAAATFMATDR